MCLQRFPIHADRMKRLPAIAALLLAASPTGAFADWVPAESLPASRQKEWTKAAPLPFTPTPEGFKAFVNRRDFGFKVLKAERCEFMEGRALIKHISESPSIGKPAYDIWSADKNVYECFRTFYETRDPLGVQLICMGIVWYFTEGTTPEQLNPTEGLHKTTKKNDCRWP